MAVVLQVTVAVCIAARPNRTRAGGAVLRILAALVAVVSGSAAGLSVPSSTGIGIGIVLFLLLRSEQAAVHTYKGGGSRPED